MEDLEDTWLQRVESARERYLAAASEAERIEAGAEYQRALGIFADLVLKRRMPPEEL
jgi:hypothetical protein